MSNIIDDYCSFDEISLSHNESFSLKSFSPRGSANGFKYHIDSNYKE